MKLHSSIKKIEFYFNDILDFNYLREEGKGFIKELDNGNI